MAEAMIARHPSIIRLRPSLKDWNERLRSECARRGIGFTRTMAEDAFDEVIRTILQKGGLAS